MLAWSYVHLVEPVFLWVQKNITLTSPIISGKTMLHYLAKKNIGIFVHFVYLMWLICSSDGNPLVDSAKIPICHISPISFEWNIFLHSFFNLLFDRCMVNENARLTVKVLLPLMLIYCFLHIHQIAGICFNFRQNASKILIYSFSRLLKRYIPILDRNMLLVLRYDANKTLSFGQSWRFYRYMVNENV